MLNRIKRQAIYNKFHALLIISFCCAPTTAAQTMRQKLDQQTEYQPRKSKPDEQLIEVARHFQIPMAIEWLDANEPAVETSQLNFKKGTVVDLISAIIARAPQESVVVEDRIVRVFAASAFNNPLNFLNLRIRRYCVSNENLLGADFEVRLAIDEMLYPEYFKNGFSGGYGGGEELFWIKQINICANRQTVRDLLTEIAAQSGSALWVAKLKPDELKGTKPFWKGVPVNEYGTSPITGHWQFVVLREYK